MEADKGVGTERGRGRGAGRHRVIERRPKVCIPAGCMQQLAASGNQHMYSVTVTGPSPM